MRSPTTGYSPSQIVLHWVVAVFVAFQLIFGESMGELFRAVRRDEDPSNDAAFWGNLHIWIGFAVLAAVSLRLALRAGRAAPPETGNRTIVLLARVTHIALYVVLIVTAVTGVVAYYWVPALGEIHELGKPVLLVLIGLHVAGALWHQFVRRDGLIMRMLVPRA
jgi:cytochrome b561